MIFASILETVKGIYTNGVLNIGTTKNAKNTLYGMGGTGVASPQLTCSFSHFAIEWFSRKFWKPSKKFI